MAGCVLLFCNHLWHHFIFKRRLSTFFFFFFFFFYPQQWLMFSSVYSVWWSPTSNFLLLLWFCFSTADIWKWPCNSFCFSFSLPLFSLAATVWAGGVVDTECRDAPHEYSGAFFSPCQTPLLFPSSIVALFIAITMYTHGAKLGVALRRYSNWFLNISAPKKKKGGKKRKSGCVIKKKRN